MKSIKPWIAGVALALGCQSPAERAIAKYNSQAKCMDRLQYTLQPEVDRPGFEREYGERECNTDVPKVDARRCAATKVGETCFLSGFPECLQRTSESEFKVDWQCSTGYNETPVKTYKAAATKDDAIVVLRLSAELSDLYTSGSREKKDSHQALSLFDRRGEHLYGYVERASEAGKQLETLLADGKKHELLLAVVKLNPSQSSDDVEVLDVVQEDWRTLAPATSEAAKKRAGDRLWKLKEAARIVARDRFLREFDASLR